MQGVDASDENDIKIKNKNVYKGEWGEDKNKTVTRDDAVKSGSNGVYALLKDYATGSDTIFIRAVAYGQKGLEEYKYQTSEESKKIIKLLNKTGSGAVDERYIGFDLNRDGYIDEVDAEYIQLYVQRTGNW